MYLIGTFGGLFFVNSQMSKFRPKKKQVLPKEEQEFVDAYIQQAQRDAHVPAWIKGFI